MKTTVAYSTGMPLLSPAYFVSSTEGEKSLSFSPLGHSFSQEIEEMLSLLAKEGVKIQKRREVIDYLLDYPTLSLILASAVQAIQKHFDSPEILLSLYEDPEMEDKYLQLHVRLDEYDEGFLEHLRAAEKEVIPHLAYTDGWLILTTDFKKKGDAF